MKPISSIPEVKSYGHEELGIRPCFKLIQFMGPSNNSNNDCCRETPPPAPTQFYKERPRCADPVYLIKPTAEEIAKIPLYHALVPVEFERAPRRIADFDYDSDGEELGLVEYWKSVIPTEYMNFPPSVLLMMRQRAKLRTEQENKQLLQ